MAGNLIIVEQWRFQKRHYHSTQAVKTLNTSSSVILRHLTRESEMWFIQALRIVFYENIPEEVLEMSCSWFLDFLERLSGFKSYFRKHVWRWSITHQLRILLKICPVKSLSFIIFLRTVPSENVLKLFKGGIGALGELSHVCCYLPRGAR